jgi:hypothetical protein
LEDLDACYLPLLENERNKKNRTATAQIQHTSREENQNPE